MRLKDADALINKLCKDCMEGYCARECYEVHLIKEQPTIEADPVRRGRWLFENIGKPNEYCVCSECGTQVDSDEAWHYCPNCGAKMDGGEEQWNK